MSTVEYFCTINFFISFQKSNVASNMASKMAAKMDKIIEIDK